MKGIGTTMVYQLGIHRSRCLVNRLFVLPKIRKPPIRFILSLSEKKKVYVWEVRGRFVHLLILPFWAQSYKPLPLCGAHSLSLLNYSSSVKYQGFRWCSFCVTVRCGWVRFHRIPPHKTVLQVTKMDRTVRFPHEKKT